MYDMYQAILETVANKPIIQKKISGCMTLIILSDKLKHSGLLRIELRVVIYTQRWWWIKVQLVDKSFTRNNEFMLAQSISSK